MWKCREAWMRKGTRRRAQGKGQKTVHSLTERSHAMQPVMLALSTFRQSELAISKALEEAQKTKKLLLVYVIDVNLARYYIGSEEFFSEEIRSMFEEEMLKVHEQRGKKYVENIETQARNAGISVKTVFQVGRFGRTCVDIMQKENPAMIVTTRSKRPEWVKKFFGSPVSYLIANASCPVIEV